MKNTPDYITTYLLEVARIAEGLDKSAIRAMINILLDVRENRGRVFALGVGGGAANASHAVNDLRKIAGIEAYAVTDNAAELTARINDEGWETAFARWLGTSRLKKNDAVFIFSVGGGNAEKKISLNLVRAMEFARAAGAKILGIVGRDGGMTARTADACVIVPSGNSASVTPHTESFQSVIMHLIVSHPELRINEMKWESVR